MHSRLGLLEMVQVKYIDRDVFPRGAKPWWFPYNRGLLEMADGVFGALFGAKSVERWRAIGAAWRGFRNRRG
jgi:hypothetical protein